MEASPVTAFASLMETGYQFYRQGYNGEALKHFKGVADTFYTTDHYEISEAMTMAGKCLRLQNELEEALRYLDEAHDSAQKSNDLLLQAIAAREMGATYLAMSIAVANGNLVGEARTTELMDHEYMSLAESSLNYARDFIYRLRVQRDLLNGQSEPHRLVRENALIISYFGLMDIERGYHASGMDFLRTARRQLSIVGDPNEELANLIMMARYSSPADRKELAKLMIMLCTLVPGATDRVKAALNWSRSNDRLSIMPE